MSTEPQFPAPTRLGGRLRFIADEVEAYKRRLAGLPVIERDPASPIVFITAQQLAADLGLTRRAIGRRVEGRVLNDPVRRWRPLDRWPQKETGLRWRRARLPKRYPRRINVRNIATIAIPFKRGRSRAANPALIAARMSRFSNPISFR